jgi:hypothetical protein
MDKSKKTKLRIIVLVAIMLVLLVVTTLISSNHAYKTRRANEKLKSVDMYRVHEYSEENSDIVMKALASGNSEKLAKAMIDSEGAAAVMDFADWKKADFENAVSLGSGSLDEGGADDNGLMEVSERFFVDIGDQRYVLFVETATSRWGRSNDGISAVAVTTFEHFDDLDWNWNGEPDDNSVLAGKLLWDAGQEDE